MKILALSDVYFPRINGVSTSIATFHREYRKRGHQPTLVAPTYPDADGERRADEVEPGILRVPSRRVPLDPEDRMMRPGALRALAPRLAEADFDVLHVQTPFVAHHAGVRLAKTLGLPTVESYHTFFEEYLHCYLPGVPRPILRWFARRTSRRQCNEVDAIVVPSAAMRQVLERYGVRARMETIPTGLRLEELQGGDGDAFRRRHGIDLRRPVLTHIGRVAHEKNIDFLLRMLLRLRHHHPDVLLAVAGEGPALPRLKRLTKALGLDDAVLFVGYLDRSGPLLDCYRAGDVFVFASRTETQGLVLLESMALGVPVVSTAVMGTRDVVGPERGAVVAEEDEDDFASKVGALLGDPRRRRRLGAEASAYAATWSAGEMAERTLALYDELRRRPREAKAA